MISEKHIESFAARLDETNALVIGDLMLDRYLWGTVSRISPEAPVPVVDVSQSEDRPGGAANVALNVAAMGARVALCGALGEDPEGDTLLGLLRDKNFDTSLVWQVAGRRTTSKTRIIGNKQQMMRVDSEQRDHLAPEVYAEMEAAIAARLLSVDVVIFEDYDKGALDPGFIRAVNRMARERGIPTVVDPKFKQFFCYEQVSLFKPNLKELNEGLGLRVGNGDLEGILAAVKLLRERMPHDNTLITLSEQGVLSVDASGQQSHSPAHFRKITDVSGAGDTVVAVVALALAADLPLAVASAIANLAGGLVCEEVGVVPIDRERLFEEMKALARS